MGGVGWSRNATFIWRKHGTTSGQQRYTALHVWHSSVAPHQLWYANFTARNSLLDAPV